jgi:acyl-coenzyme A synthetase/AMP-(fatty) acid ligase
MIEHRSLVNFLRSMQREPGMKKEDVLLAVTAISFDIAALELFLPLFVGASLVIAGRDMIADPVLMANAIQHYGVTIMQATPATWQLLTECGWEGKPGLKALCGGEMLTRKLADQLLNRVGSLWNMYGPTETTIWSSVASVHEADTVISIGHPIDNTQLYVLDQYLNPVAVGVQGELHIGGKGLARGYVNLVDLTSKKFIPDPFVLKLASGIYKTGDRARYLPDGSIEILGRFDHQVKIHGHRIELGEIETVLRQHPLLVEAVVVLNGETNCAKRLVAYYVPSPEQHVDEVALQDFVRKKLPAYMIPNAWVCLEQLPLSPNGKLDRKALPAPEMISQNEYVGPRNEEERILVDIWEGVLGVKPVSVLDNFFDLGGASIQSLQIVGHANMAGLGLSAEMIFEYQTIAELAEQLRAGIK